ncbi:MAG TPA: hypothetical protein IAC04_05625 [Candidatus Coprenecus stercoravium]|uniref:Uncharacterized protein n=1 Tax=Candidatus Coprenecus stercoravium TaxID=2840735 RepID=A0A9D2GRJ5_9BACT|nr:hypothetical protein [Candidatus Coprenecus stercoravium]
MNEREYRLNITDRFDDDGQRTIFISVSVPREESPEAVETLMRAANDIVFGCDTELFIPDMEDPEALIPGHNNDQDIHKGKSDE